MSAFAAEVPVARSYTRARRHPWVIGKLGEITLWLGPYSRPQLVVAGVGSAVLIKTYAWWAPVLGPVPVAALVLAVWAARRTRIGGRVPEAAVWGWLLVMAQPRPGRIDGRVARDRAGAELVGGYFVTDTRGTRPSRAATATAAQDAHGAQAGAQRRARDAQPTHAPAAARAVAPGPGPGPGPRSALDELLAQARARASREG